MKTGQMDRTAAYRRMFLIRCFEQAALALGRDGHVAGSIHLCLGQEAIPVGTMAALSSQDRVLSTYRGHGWALACGTSPEALMAEIGQRAGGVNGGRAGSPLLSDPQVGFFGENSIVGAGSPIAAGVALASSFRKDNRVVVTSFGDGAMNQGSTNEGMIFAAMNNLPVIFICENNGWAELTPTSATTRGADLAQRAQGIGIENHVVDGCDPFAVAAAVSAAAETCRAGNGPVFLECKTIRLSGHYNKDIEHYRPKADVEAAAQRDPVPRLRSELLSLQEMTEEEIGLLEQSVISSIDAIVASVIQMPAPTAANVLEHVYAPDKQVTVGGWGARSEATDLTFQRAVNQALRDELDIRPEMLVYGEDVGNAGGIFGITRSLQKDYGVNRVFDTPISESAILGSAVGAAMEGMVPVVEIMWADFVFVALDQIINQASNVRYINRGQLSAPITIRMQQGVTPGSCAQHSQSVEAVLAHIPGIKIGLPSNPQDAYEMTRAAIADPDPTILIEARSLYQNSAPVVTGGDAQVVGGSRSYGSGTDLLIITWGVMVGKSLEAAQGLSESGVNVTVLDLRWLRPLDSAAIDLHVRQCGGKVLIVHEDVLSGGFGAEVAAQISERHFGSLAAPVMRLGALESRIPSAPSLQAAVLPSVTGIISAARELATGKPLRSAMSDV